LPIALTLSEVAALLTLLFVLRSLIRNQHCETSVSAGDVMMSINAMSKTEAFEYLRAELQALNSILGELIAVFRKTLIDQWEQDGRPGISPADRRYPLDELSKMATEWLQTRNTLH
jgi:hypothetical protein